MHIIPHLNILNSSIFQLRFDFGYGLDEAFKENLELVLFVVCDKTVNIGLVLLCSWDLVHELFSKGVE